MQKVLSFTIDWSISQDKNKGVEARLNPLFEDGFVIFQTEVIGNNYIVYLTKDD